jgi:hypothetical protein
MKLGFVRSAGARGAAAMLLVALPAAAQWQEGVVNIKEAGAKGDGKTDDTAALQAVFGAGKGKPHPKYGNARRIYIPNGTYLVRDEIKWGDKKKHVVGESREGVVIKLADNAPGYQDPRKPKCVLNNQFGHAGQNFSQYIRNVTVDVGAGNPGAIAVRFHTNNGGGLINATLRSSDPKKAGHVGLWMPSWPGPGLTKNVLIDGFDTGIAVGSDQYSWTFVDVTLRGQRKLGFLNAGNTVSIFRLTSHNSAAAVENRGGSAFMALADCRFTGGAADAPAMRNIKGAKLFVRNTTVEGYAKAVANEAGTGKDAEGKLVRAYGSHVIRNLFGAPARPIGLQWEDPSEVPAPDPKRDKIAHVADYEPPAGDYNNQTGSPDCGEAIQKAIDSGADYVAMPAKGFFVCKRSIRVRGNVRKVYSLGSRLNFRLPAAPAWILEDGRPDVVEISVAGTYGSRSLGIEHASKRTLICAGQYYNTVPGGKVFMQNFVGSPIVFDRQKAWMASVNTETYEIYPHIANYGGDLFVVGHKTEKDRPAIGTYDGGRTEVLGGLLYKNRNPLPECPAMIIRDAYAFYAYRQKGHRYVKWVLEERGGVERIQGQQGIYASAPDGVVVPKPMNRSPGEPIEILGVMYEPDDPAAELRLVLHYRRKGDGEFAQAPLKKDEYARWNGAIPAAVGKAPVEYYVAAVEAGKVAATWPKQGAAAPAVVLPDTTPPELPGDPWIAAHFKWGYLLAWEEAADKETRVLFYTVYRGKTKDGAAKTVWQKLLCSQLHLPFATKHVEPGTWLGVQAEDYAGHKGAIRFVQFQPGAARAFNRGTSKIK